MKNTRIPVPKELPETIKRLREANLSGPWLLTRALPALASFATKLRDPASRPTAIEQIDYLRALCLQAEIYDHYAEYKKAEEVLLGEGKRLKGLLEAGDLGHEAQYSQSGQPYKPLLRQQLWTLVLCSHSLYRDEALSDALALLYKICKQIDRHLPLDPKVNPDEPSFGLRARCAYSLGQVKRQMGDVPGARKEFMRAIEFTKRRLETKIAKYNSEDVELVRLREQKNANYVIAKAFCFGLAWASFNSGELQRARCSSAAGCALLQFTDDDVHKAYAQVMHAQILAAGARPIQAGDARPPELEEARFILLELAEGAQSPLRKVPKFLARAQYALAQVFYATGELEASEKYAQQVYKNQKEQEKGRRWHLESAALLVRLLLSTARVEEAQRQSDEFIALTQDKNVSKNHKADAYLCRAEVLMRSRRSFKEIGKALSKAEVLWQKNPLALALCHLHRARFYALQNNLGAARSELHKWNIREHTIEHGYMHKLADEVRVEIARAARKEFNFNDMMGKDKYKGALAQLKKMAIAHLFAIWGPEYLTNDNPLKELGVSRPTVLGWQRELGFDPRQMDGMYQSRSKPQAKTQS